MAETRFKNFLPIIIILTCITLALRQVVFFEYTMKWDIMDQFFPCRFFISECLNHKIFPLWCPYINFGYPFYADPQGGTFYPLTWVISLVSGYNVYSIAYDYIIHVTIAAVAFYYLLKGLKFDKFTAVVFGCVYALSGIFVSNAQHLTWAISLAWMPLIILNFKNIFDGPNIKNALGLALFSYLGLTGGYPGIFIILFYFFLVYAMVRFFILIKNKQSSEVARRFWFLSASGLVFLLLSAGFLYSFIEAIPHISRGTPIDLHEANNNPLSPKAMVSFLFPFATTCTATHFDTDISMTNVYCGFLLLPLLVIAFFKGRIQNFEKAFFAFAFICLMAALGKYFFVRGLLFKTLPGLNMIRHASIFRVFAVFGFILIAATGFDYLLKSIREKSNLSFIKKMLSGYFGFLLFVAVVVFIKSKEQMVFLSPFNAASVNIFNATKNVYSHILFQTIIQLLFLGAVLIALYTGFLNEKRKAILICAIVLSEIIISVQLNLPATIVSDVKPAELQAKLNKMSKGFPVPELKPMDSFTHFSDGTTPPIWYNISFFKKIPAKDGFNNFCLQSVFDLDSSRRRSEFLKRPVVFFSDSEVRFGITKFGPNEVMVHYQANKNSKISLQQNFYRGWIAFIDGQEQQIYPELCTMNFPVPSGEHIVRFAYRRPLVKWMFIFSMGLLMFIGIFLVAVRNRKT